MLTKSLFVRLEAKPGKENDVAAFLKQGLELANQETTTPTWFALRLGPSTFAIFDAFRDEQGRQNHLNGPIAQALMAQAPTLLASPPVIERMDVLGAKLAAGALDAVYAAGPPAPLRGGRRQLLPGAGPKAFDAKGRRSHETGCRSRRVVPVPRPATRFCSDRQAYAPR